MALTFDLTAIEDFEKRCYVRLDGDDGQYMVAAKTQEIVLTMMVLGVDEITEDNLFEVACRVEMYNRLFGQLHQGISTGDLKAHVGLKTNANVETMGRWRNRMAKQAAREIERQIEAELSAA